MSTSFDGQADVWEETHPRAAKRHQCSACREAIPIGHRYSKTAVLYEGEWDTVRRCMRCDEMYRALKRLHADADMLDWENGVAPSLDCGHDFREVFDREPPPELARLAFVLPDEMQSEALR